MIKISTLQILGICMLIMRISTMSAQVTYQWQQAHGGSVNDGAISISATADGGYVVGGYSYSGLSGDKTMASFGGQDYWVLKLDVDGNIQWQKAYGGSGLDRLNEVVQTADGGYLVGGYSESLVSGNKTENSYAGTPDVWVLRLDSLGNILWQTCLGGSGIDMLGDVNETADGGCIIGAYSTSGNSGDKTEPSKGIYDYWIIKLNSSGSIVWQNTIGGTWSDYCSGAQQLPDGGYFISGYSSSPISFDKTEACVGPFNNNDAWIMKLDASGNILWQNVIGGSSNDNLTESKLTPDNGAILALYSSSNISGDKSENTIAGVTTDADFWVVKVDATGNVVWENTIGGIDADLCYDVTLMSDGGYALAGYSLSPMSGDKTTGVYASSFDYWIVGVDALGNVLWDRNYGTYMDDYCYGITTGADGMLVAVGDAESVTTGDKIVTGNGWRDFWLIKLRNVCIPTDEVCNDIDDDCDGIIDEAVVENVYIVDPGITTVCQGTPVNMASVFTAGVPQWYKNGVAIPGAIGIYYTATVSGNYTCVTTSDCGADTSNVVHITVNKNPKASISASGSTTFCAGGSVTLTEIPTAGCTYQWMKGASLVAGATSNVYVATTTGNYKCLVTKTATGCTKTSNTIPVNVTCRINGAEDMSMTLYPNPAHDMLMLEIPNNEVVDILIYDQSGKLIKTIPAFESGDLDINMLAAGTYLVQAVNVIHQWHLYFIKQ